MRLSYVGVVRPYPVPVSTAVSVTIPRSSQVVVSVGGGPFPRCVRTRLDQRSWQSPNRGSPPGVMPDELYRLRPPAVNECSSELVACVIIPTWGSARARGRYLYLCCAEFISASVWKRYSRRSCT